MSDSCFPPVVLAGQVWHNPRGKSKPPGNRRPRRSWCETSPSRPQSKNCENSSGEPCFTFNGHFFFIVYCVSCVYHRIFLLLEIIGENFSLTKMTDIIYVLDMVPCDYCKIVSHVRFESFKVQVHYVMLDSCVFFQYVWRTEDSPPAKERDRWSPPWFWLH